MKIGDIARASVAKLALLAPNQRQRRRLAKTMAIAPKKTLMARSAKSEVPKMSDQIFRQK